MEPGNKKIAPDTEINTDDESDVLDDVRASIRRAGGILDVLRPASPPPPRNARLVIGVGMIGIREELPIALAGSDPDSVPLLDDWSDVTPQQKVRIKRAAQRELRRRSLRAAAGFD